MKASLSNASNAVIRFFLFQSAIMHVEGKIAESDAITNALYANCSEAQMDHMLEDVNWVAENCNKETYEKLCQETEEERVKLSAEIFTELVESLT